ncbi:putative fscC [Rhodococcus sp. MTM3W5.2]|uniref:polyketide synthase dehydratase domain-containing protein n=1 Tax=Rhodococcus sp. MTM3W5.2 TaxID=1805827 RepID=UPI0009793789|nr:polyketide synthase dehydratase domain-containing protein [Rhodococcus sp. MTM3W5.2]AQA25076.1 putative fscC [Rhodococcus sp. MTM3W5.2]
MGLPTYAFDHTRYWMNTGGFAVDPESLGQAVAGHPLLGAVVSLPDTGGVVVTGRLSLQTQPWLVDCRVNGVALFPATGLVEVVIRAGDETGTPYLRELTVLTPLLLPEDGARYVQVVVGAADHDSGDRAVTVYSRRDTGAGEWLLHARGALTAADMICEDAESKWEQWPPVGALQVDVVGLYENFAEVGHEYGPVFQGLQKIWRRGDEMFVQAGLPADTVNGFGLHPALLDAVLQVLILDPATGAVPRLPFAWERVRLAAVGAQSVRARITKTASGVAVEVVDESGRSVLSIGQLSLREIAAGQLDTSTRAGDPLLRVDWKPVAANAGVNTVSYQAWSDVAGIESGETAPVAPLVVLDLRDTTAAARSVTTADAAVAGVHARVSSVLAVVQQFTAAERFASSTLLVLTSGAVAVASGAVSDLAAAAVWGLMRSAQSEVPGRFVLADIDTAGGLAGEGTAALLTAVLAVGEPQMAVRAGALFVPRLQRISALAVSPEEVPVAERVAGGTVVITGGTGGWVRCWPGIWCPVTGCDRWCWPVGVARTRLVPAS